MDAIAAVYTNPRKPGSFQGIEKVRRSLGDEVKANNVKEYLKGKDSYTLHRVAKRKYKRTPIIACFIDDQWQGDLAEMQGWASSNNGVRYLLVLIDIVSKYMWVEPLKTKEGPEVLRALKKILVKSKRKPKKLQTDDGTEFWYRGVQKFLQDQNIHFFTLKSDQKAMVVERAIRTLKDKIHRYMTENNSKKYINVLQDLVASYNDTYHSAIKMAPSEVKSANEGQVLENLYGYLWKDENAKIKETLKPGVFVRLATAKKKFEKGFVGNWTEEIFIVDKLLSRNPVRYTVKDWNGEKIKGSFYGEELQEIKVEKEGYWKVEKILKTRKVGRRTEYLVKWANYDMTSWVRDIKRLGKKK